jgi:predicted lipoprotein
VTTPSRSAIALPGASRAWIAVGVVVAALAVLVAFDPPWVVESLDSSSGGSSVAGSQNLNPDRYVAAIWASKLLPTVKRSAVDLPTLLRDLRKDRAATSKRYGHYAVLDGPPAFLIKGAGRVVSVDTASLVSKAGIAFGSGQRPDAFVQLGPILSGTDVRDALPFINFNQFVNQVQFGEVAIAINSKIAQTAFAHVDYAKLKGKRVKFAGAFTLSEAKTPLVTPVTFEVAR